jgi:hypothetical protein
MHVSNECIKESCLIFVFCLLILPPLNLGSKGASMQHLLPQIVRAPDDDVSDQPTVVILLSEDFELGDIPSQGWDTTITNEE